MHAQRLLVRLQQIWQVVRRAYFQVRAFYLARLRPVARALFFLSGVAAAVILALRIGFEIPPESRALLAGLTNAIAVYYIVYEFLSLLFAGESWKTHLRSHAIELLLAFALLLKFLLRGDLIHFLTIEGLRAEEATLAVLSFTNAALLFQGFLHGARNAQFSRLLKVNPAVVFIASFVLVIALGTLLLLLPRSSSAPLSFADHLFTAVSATCVTGLTTVNIAESYTRTGEIIVLVLIQIGGLGLMTLTSFFSFFFSGSVSIKYGQVMKELLSEESMGRVRSLVRDVAVFALGIETLGAVFFYFTAPPELAANTGERVYHAIFHSVSAFCNAGISLYSGGMVDVFPEGRVYLSGMMVLIVLGGLGFPVISELVRRAVSRQRVRRLSLHARIVLWTNLFFHGLGFAAFWALEAGGEAIGDMAAGDQAFQALFHTVTSRTAGFNITDTAGLALPTAFFTILLMWVGASPASTGGGIKTSTIAVAFLYIFQRLRGSDQLELFRRTVPDSSVFRAVATALLSLWIIFAGIFALTIFETAPFFDLVFETVSAFGTVGLSRGVTAELSDASKFALCVVMLAGRVGILTVFIALLPREKSVSYRYPGEYVMVG